MIYVLKENAGQAVYVPREIKSHPSSVVGKLERCIDGSVLAYLPVSVFNDEKFWVTIDASTMGVGQFKLTLYEGQNKYQETLIYVDTEESQNQVFVYEKD